jgi:hypothetical protein
MSFSKNLFFSPSKCETFALFHFSKLLHQPSTPNGHFPIGISLVKIGNPDLHNASILPKTSPKAPN